MNVQLQFPFVFRVPEKITGYGQAVERRIAWESEQFLTRKTKGRKDFIEKEAIQEKTGRPEAGRSAADPSTEIEEKTVKYLTIGWSIWYKKEIWVFLIK